MPIRKKSVSSQAYMTLSIALFCFTGGLMFFAVDASADIWGCMDNCLTQKHICICDECEAYSPEQCPQNPYCAAGSPIYPGCRSCIQNCQKVFQECKRACAGSIEDVLCVGVKCPSGYKCEDGNCVPKTNPPPMEDPCKYLNCGPGYKCKNGACIPKKN
ncbi:MAG: hypothetical protein EHM45_00095 [Desulfobacteraceae bacterium]|nr:MAG: hypothetical protein EHM45_00095 [Desulfobacteraceae bacterium]